MALPPPTRLVNSPGPTNGTSHRKPCHSEGAQRPRESPGTSWQFCRIFGHRTGRMAYFRSLVVCRTWYREIPTGFALGMTWFSSVVPFNRPDPSSNLVGVGSATRPTDASSGYYNSLFGSQRFHRHATGLWTSLLISAGTAPWVCRRFRNRWCWSARRCR